ARRVRPPPAVVAPALDVDTLADRPALDAHGVLTRGGTACGHGEGRGGRRRRLRHTPCVDPGGLRARARRPAAVGVAGADGEAVRRGIGGADLHGRRIGRSEAHRLVGPRDRLPRDDRRAQWEGRGGGRARAGGGRGRLSRGGGRGRRRRGRRGRARRGRRGGRARRRGRGGRTRRRARGGRTRRRGRRGRARRGRRRGARRGCRGGRGSRRRRGGGGGWRRRGRGRGGGHRGRRGRRRRGSRRRAPRRTAAACRARVTATRYAADTRRPAGWRLACVGAALDAAPRAAVGGRATTRHEAWLPAGGLGRTARNRACARGAQGAVLDRGGRHLVDAVHVGVVIRRARTVTLRVRHRANGGHLVGIPRS